MQVPFFYMCKYRGHGDYQVCDSVYHVSFLVEKNWEAKVPFMVLFISCLEPLSLVVIKPFVCPVWFCLKFFILLLSLCALSVSFCVEYSPEYIFEILEVI